MTVRRVMPILTVSEPESRPVTHTCGILGLREVMNYRIGSYTLADDELRHTGSA